MPSVPPRAMDDPNSAFFNTLAMTKNPFKRSDYSLRSLPGIRVKVTAHKDFEKELKEDESQMNKNNLQKSLLPLQDVIEDVVKKHAGAKKYALFASQTLAVDLNMPLTVFPPCRLIQVLFLGGETESFLLSLYDDADEAKSGQVLSYTQRLAMALKERLFITCGVSFVLMACCLRRKDFSAAALTQTVTDRFRAVRPHTRSNLLLTSDNVHQVRTAALILAGSVRDPEGSKAKEEFLTVERAWRNLISIFIEHPYSGQPIELEKTPSVDHVKVEAALQAIEDRQRCLKKEHAKKDTKIRASFVCQPESRVQRTEVVFKEGEYQSDESEYEWSSDDEPSASDESSSRPDCKIQPRLDIPSKMGVENQKVEQRAKGPTA